MEYVKAYYVQCTLCLDFSSVACRNNGGDFPRVHASYIPKKTALCFYEIFTNSSREGMWTLKYCIERCAHEAWTLDMDIYAIEMENLMHFFIYFNFLNGFRIVEIIDLSQMEVSKQDSFRMEIFIHFGIEKTQPVFE